MTVSRGARTVSWRSSVSDGMKSRVSKERRSAMGDAISARAHTATTWSAVLSVLMIGAGVFAMGLPLMAGFAVGALIAWLLLFSGVLHLAFAWRSHTAGGVV